MLTERFLLDDAQALLTESPEARIAYVQSDKWFGHRTAQAVIRRIEGLLRLPRTHRMQNMVLVAETNNGKTKIVRKILERHRPQENANGDAALCPIVYIQAPPGPSELRLYVAILAALYALLKPSARVYEAYSQVLRVCSATNVRLLIIDEFHHSLAGSQSKQREFLNAIKHLGNDLQIPILAVGTDLAYNALQVDAQLANRFEPVELPLWTMNAEYRGLLEAIERTLPLPQRSHLASPDLAQLILSLSEGTIGEIATLASRAARHAIETGKPFIDAHTIEAADYMPPSKRRRRLLT